MILIPICVFLLALFAIGKDDFYFLRRNVSISQLFDIAFLVGLLGILFSRITYITSHFASGFLNPLVFFLIPYFPGSSMAGFLLGGTVLLYILPFWKKLPVGRMYDVYALSFLTASATFFFIDAVNHAIHHLPLPTGETAGLFFLAVILFVVLKNIFSVSSWRDGSVGIIGLYSCSILFFAWSLLVLHIKLWSLDNAVFAILWLLLFFGFIVKKSREVKHAA